MKFLKEVKEQPKALLCLAGKVLKDEQSFYGELSEVFKSGNFTKIIFTGMGSSLYACIPTVSYLCSNRILAFCLDASELLHYFSRIIDKKTLLIGVSQSGDSVEVVKLAEKVGRKAGGFWLCTNNLDCGLASEADRVVNIHAGEEISTASKTYTNTVAALYLTGVSLSREMVEADVEVLTESSELMEKTIEKYEAKSKRLAEVLVEYPYITLIGRGPSLASAQQGALIMKEAARVCAEGIGAGQFRHGPLEITGKSHAAIIFSPNGKTQSLNQKLAVELAGYGSTTILVTDKIIKDQPKNLIVIGIPQVKEELSPLLQIIPLELITDALASLKGISIGEFEKITKVTRRE